MDNLTQKDILGVINNKTLLFDFYGALLTQKQRDVFTMSTMEDCSFAEIGQEMGITPQAVGDILKRATAQLQKYENSLGMVQKLEYQKQVIKEIEILLDKEVAKPLCTGQSDTSSLEQNKNHIKDLLDKLLL